MAQSTSQFELPLKKNKLGFFVLILQTRQKLRSIRDLTWGNVTCSHRRHVASAPLAIRAPDLRQFKAQGLWKAPLCFFLASSSPSKSGLGFLKSSYSLGWTLEEANLFFSRVCWIEIDMAQVLFAFLWICCRIKAHVQTQLKLRFRADHCSISPFLFRKLFLYHT